MSHNRYYEIELADENIQDILAICVEVNSSFVPSLDNTNTIVKLCVGDHVTYEVLNSYIELTHDQAVELSHSEKYTPSE